MKKYSADIIYTLSSKPILNGIVIVNDDNVIIDILDNNDNNLDDVIYFSGCICPGFINSHCHLELSHLINKIPPKTGLIPFIKNLQIVRTQSSNEEISASIEEAERSMINNGIVAVGDVSNSPISFAQKEKNNLKYHTFIEILGINRQVTEVLLEATKLLSIAPQTACIVPHSPYTVSQDMFKHINNISNLNSIISIHNQESQQENRLYKNKTGQFLDLYKHFNISLDSFIPYGQNSVQVYLPWMTQGKKLLVHNTFTSQNDINFIKQFSNIYLCLCPNANLYIENCLPNIYMLQKSQVPIVIGTDSLASNSKLSIFSEIMTILEHFPKISLEQVLIWACKNPAELFNYKELGTIEIGKQPGLININLEKKEILLITKTNF